jgi:[acyl-carrier-protein] S-malonyltransferase
VFLASHLHYLALASLGLRTQLSIGLSLGEFNHLVHIGAIDFIDALQLVDERGRCCDAGPPGKMMAVMPLETDELEGHFSDFEADGILEIVNYNSPTQHVIGGHAHLVDKMAGILEDEAFAICVDVNERSAMHSRLMDSAAEAFFPALRAVTWRTPQADYRPNVEPETLLDSSERIPELLKRHLSRPIHFRRSLEHLLAAGKDTVLVEVGPGNTLSNLVARWRREPVYATDDIESDRARFDTVAAKVLRFKKKT